MDFIPVPANRREETLLRLVADLVRRPWSRIGADHYLDDYERSQWLTPTPLGELQRAKLRRLVWHCFLRVPYFSAELPRALTPSQIERLDDVTRLPPVPDAVRRGQPERFVAQPELPVADERRSERGLRVAIDGESLERRTAVRLRAERWAGAGIVAVWGRESVRPPRALDPAEVAAIRTAVERVPQAVISGPAAALEALTVALTELKPRNLAQRLLRDRTRITAVIARGPDRDDGAARLAEATSARLHRWYLAAEAGLIAASCDRAPAPDVLHVMADHLLLEALDDAGRPVAAGAPGRLHLTDLHNYATPFVRHDLGDRGRLLARPCACGRALPLVQLA